jgi:SMI1/KNR4 family protein SUKH-1
VSTIGKRLREHWAAQGMKRPSGVAENRLKEFEARFSVCLPLDFRLYFLDTNGMGSRDVYDSDVFCFWPLEEVVGCNDEFSDRFIDDQSAYFVFADHAICAPAYAIRLTPSGAGPNLVIAIFSDQREYSTAIVAGSFGEFAERYLAAEIP